MFNVHGDDKDLSNNKYLIIIISFLTNVGQELLHYFDTCDEPKVKTKLLNDITIKKQSPFRKTTENNFCTGFKYYVLFNRNNLRILRRLFFI